MLTPLKIHRHIYKYFNCYQYKEGTLAHYWQFTLIRLIKLLIALKNIPFQLSKHLTIYLMHNYLKLLNYIFLLINNKKYRHPHNMYQQYFQK